ncbi:TetR/AcrR family transcriptional repressor of nem operon [Variovorax boronicumulans]|uniref:TetR/AcrR family transcriptional regulator n=1 Tax=Variovorax boronicumulans TaxID=436515 RepID=UPI0027899EDD|nr:TetR/AcrR family transcriptional regulator [Variovorax boronicumulans]MDQ0085994.1 TetR/AcrR family transcriptional repressor of nem operon [Variovorax boronicumulans]
MNAIAPTPDVRQHILDVAHPLLLQRGFTGVGLAEVLAAAKVPKGSFYHYFGSKEAFGEAVLEAYFTEYLGRTDALLTEAPGTAAQRLIGYFDDWLDSQTGDDAQSRCLVVKLGAEVCDLSESMRAALARGTRGITDRLARCIEAGRADGSLQPPPQAKEQDAQGIAVALYQRWLGASLLAKITRDRASLDMAMRDTRQLLGLSPDT